MNRNASKLVVLNLEESVIAALAKLAPEASLPVAGKLVASKDLQAQLQGHVDTINALNDARAKVSQLVARDQGQRAGIAPVLTGIRNYAAGPAQPAPPATPAAPAVSADASGAPIVGSVTNGAAH